MGAWVYLGNSITAEEPGEAEPSWSLSQSLESDEPGEEGGEVAHSQHSEGWKRYKKGSQGERVVRQVCELLSCLFPHCCTSLFHASVCVM